MQPEVIEPEPEPYFLTLGNIKWTEDEWHTEMAAKLCYPYASNDQHGLAERGQIQQDTYKPIAECNKWILGWMTITHTKKRFYDAMITYIYNRYEDENRDFTECKNEAINLTIN